MIDNEILREEIRKIIREEVHYILFEKREYEKSLTTYMKSLIYSEIRYLKMLESGWVHSKEKVEYYFNLQSSNNNFFSVEKGISLKIIYNNLVTKGMTDTPFNIFKSVILNKNKNSQKINWTSEVLKSRANFQRAIFDLLYSLDSTIVHAKLLRRKLIMSFVANSFLLNGEPLLNSKMDNTFSKWKKIKQKSNYKKSALLPY